MVKDHKLLKKQYGHGRLMENIEDCLKRAGKDLTSLSIDDLAPIDGFHTRGRESTIELVNLANLRASDLVLDVGCGLGGTARYLAEQYNCRVHGIDLTEEYIAVGEQLTEMLGMKEDVHLKLGNANSLPYEGQSFDVVWTEHVQMNIADKNRFYSEIFRILKPGGRFLFHDVFQGTGGDAFYPLPWAQDSSISFLATEVDAQTAMSNVGLDVKKWIAKGDDSIRFFEKVAKRFTEKELPPLGVHLLMGDNTKDKIYNFLRNLREERLSVVMGIASKQA
jgi:ubiquinone/menaquinone biosynthesis C-methylase UbiE